MAAIPAVSDINQSMLEKLPIGTIQVLQWALQGLPARLSLVSSSSSDPDHAPLSKYRVGHPACPTYTFKIECTNDPQFDKLVRKYGKKLAFHGSPMENFHSILQNGLKNMSGTRHMSTGAAFGDGIYLAQDLKVAHSFTKGGVRTWEKSRFNKLLKEPGRKCRVSFRCVIACEVINHPDNVLKNEGGNGEEAYYVVPDAAHVRGCFLLFYQDVGAGQGFQCKWGTVLMMVAVAALIAVSLSYLAQASQ